MRPRVVAVRLDEHSADDLFSRLPRGDGCRDVPPSPSHPPGRLTDKSPAPDGPQCTGRHQPNCSVQRLPTGATIVVAAVDRNQVLTRWGVGGVAYPRDGGVFSDIHLP